MTAATGATASYRLTDGADIDSYIDPHGMPAVIITDGTTEVTVTATVDVMRLVAKMIEEACDCAPGTPLRQLALANREACDPVDLDAFDPWERVTIGELAIGDKVIFGGAESTVTHLGDAGVVDGEQWLEVRATAWDGTVFPDGRYASSSPVMRCWERRCEFTDGDGVRQAHYPAEEQCDQHGTAVAS